MFQSSSFYFVESFTTLHPLHFKVMVCAGMVTVVLSGGTNRSLSVVDPAITPVVGFVAVPICAGNVNVIRSDCGVGAGGFVTV